MADKNLQCNDARNQEKDDEEALGSHPKAEQDIVQVTPPSCSPNIFEEVCIASDLPIFRFDRNFIIDASIRNILISNFERPMKKGNLLASNKVVIEHIGQPITPFIKTDSDLLLQPKLSLLLYLKFISIWVALLISYLACTWYQLRHVCSNYFRFRNLKPRLNSVEKTDASIISYPKTSEIECKTQCIAEWCGAKFEPFVCLIPKPFSHQDRLENKRFTFNSNMCDKIFDLLLRNNYIRILDHHVEPSVQGRMYCKLHDSSKHNFEDCNMFRQIVKPAIDKGRLKFVETPRDHQSIPIGPDGRKFLHRLLQADPFKHEKVKTTCDGIKFSSKEVVEEHNEHNLEGENSIKATMETPMTGGAARKSNDR